LLEPDAGIRVPSLPRAKFTAEMVARGANRPLPPWDRQLDGFSWRFQGRWEERHSGMVRQHQANWAP